MNKLAAIFIALFTALSAEAAGAQPRLVGLADLKGVSTLPGNSLATSADGRVAIESDGALRVTDAAGKTFIDLGPGLLPEWSPNGRRLAFYSSRSGDLQIWIWTASSGELRQITHLQGGVDADPTTRIDAEVASAFRLRWSPEGESIVFASRVASASVASMPGAPLVVDNASPPGLAVAGALPPMSLSSGIPESPDGRSYRLRSWNGHRFDFSKIHLVNVTSERVVSVLGGPNGDYFAAIWSGDGKSIFAVRLDRPAGSLSVGDVLWDYPGPTKSTIVQFDLRSSHEMEIAKLEGVGSMLAASRDGRSLAYIMHSEVTKPGKPTVLRLEDKSRFEYIADDWPFQIEWNDALSSFSLFTCDAMCTIQSMRLVGDRLLRKVLVGPRRISTWSQSAHGSLTVLDGGELTVRALDGKLHKMRVEASTDQLELGEVQTVSWKAPDGELLTGTLLLPPSARSGRQYPVIVDTYPMTLSGGWMSPHQGNQAWASAGYAVFRPLLRAPNAWMNTIRSEAFSLAAKGGDGWTVTMRDLMGGLDALEKTGWIDRRRMCLFGHSNGGGVATYIITQTNEFRCAVILAPNSVDWVSPSLLAPSGRKQYGMLVGREIEESVSEYISLSSAFQLHKVKTPVLLGVGDDDSAFLLNAIVLYNGLRATDAPVQFVRYPGQGHYISGDALKDFWAREMAFFDKFLMPSVMSMKPTQ